ncbi:hypothetical protein CVT26_008083 [Gymnopilus dilepis]|uniref:ribonuclease T2 n=1 Tax=Gymnopilus dilepis TaxID=231916 RepID=A0A409YJS8_9AGAR|nr:hypothetical protein CVT26_008083 [Gymnopilus dilepis]
MFSVILITYAASALLRSVSAGQSAFVSSICPNPGISCHNTTVAPDLCCFESPGGLLLQTQFWDTNPPTGPADSWTIHGLWPDNCDGTYIENCDPSRNYKNIGNLLRDNGAGDTLDFMNQFWVNDPEDGTNEEFWEHEWATHGTCYSTLRPSCLPDDSIEGAEAITFFQTVVGLFQTLPTYTWLANEGILPSSDATYSLAQLSNALSKQSGGFVPAFSCSHKALNSISWYFNLRGSLVDGNFILIDAPLSGNCPKKGIHYLPKNGDLTSSLLNAPRKRSL